MDEEIFATYIESRGERRYFKDKRFKEPFRFTYDYNDGSYYGFKTENIYEEIKSYFDAGCEITCRVMCGASFFELRLARHIYAGSALEDNMFSFDCLTYNGQETYWFVNLRIWQDGSDEYSEGYFNVHEN